MTTGYTKLPPDEGTGGDIANDPIWEAKGDLVAAVSNDSAVRLPVGTNGQVLTADSAETAGLKWITPSGSTPTGTANTFAVYDGSGNLDEYSPLTTNLTNGIDLNQSVAPAATGAYIKHNNAYFQVNPSVNSDENWYAQWMEPRINDTGFNMGNPATGDGGLNGLGMAMTANGNFGYMRNFDFSLQMGDGTNPISGYSMAAINQYINVSNNAEVEFINGFPLVVSGQSGSTIENISGYRLNLNVENCTNSILGFNIDGNATFTGTGTYYTGISLNPTIVDVENANGIFIDMTNVSSTNNPLALNIIGNSYFDGDLAVTGGFSFSGDLSVGSIACFKATNIVNTGGTPVATNNIVSQFDGSGTVALCDSIGLSTPSLINLDATFAGTSGGFGLGIASLALPNLISMQAGCSLDNLTAAAYVNLFDAGNTGGTIDRVIGCRSTNIFQGGTQTITRSYNFFADYFAGDGAVDSWGFYDNGAKHNWMSGGLKIGGTSGSSDTVTNSSIGLELQDKALRLAAMDTTARNALTAVAGMVIFNTTTAALEYYDGTAWV
jgi:hypothetical protein